MTLTLFFFSMFVTFWQKQEMIVLENKRGTFFSQSSYLYISKVYSEVYHLPSESLTVQSQQYKHWRKVWNMFKVNNKDTKTTSVMSLKCFYCQLWTYITPLSIVSIAKFEQVNVNWVGIIHVVETCAEFLP